MARKSLLKYFLVTILFSIGVFLTAAQDAIPLSKLGEKLSATISYDPMTKTGLIEKSGQFASFSVGQAEILWNWKLIRKTVAPYEDKGTILCPPEFVNEVIDYIGAQAAKKNSKFTVAAILVDPGHGGKDTGAIGEFKGLRLLEKNINLIVAKHVVELLRSKFPERKIMITRTGDTYPTLDERVNMANRTKLASNEAIIYISIHANASFNKTAKGFEVWYLNPQYRRTLVDAGTAKEKGTDIAPILNSMMEEEFTTESIILAKNVYDRMSETIGSQSPPRGIRAEEWFVVKNAKMPSILIEMGFVTNPEEAKLLSTDGYLRKIGDAIYNGIVDFIDQLER
jgi:N-acetylmuramoyl-L-alanine amidase